LVVLDLLLLQKPLYKTDKIVAFITQKKINTTNPDESDLYQFGILARVEKLIYSGKTGMNAWVKGISRIELDSIEAQRPFIVAKVNELSEVIEDSPEIKLLTKGVMDNFQKLVNLGNQFDFLTITKLMEGSSPNELADQVAYILNISDFRETKNIRNIIC